MVTWATSQPWQTGSNQPWQTSSRQAEFTFQPAELRYRQRRHSRGMLGAPRNTWAGLHHQVCSPGPPDDSRLEAPAGRGIPDPTPPHPTPHEQDLAACTYGAQSQLGVHTEPQQGTGRRAWMAGRAWGAVNVRQLSLPAVLRILGPPGFAPKQYVMSPIWASVSER